MDVETMIEQKRNLSSVDEGSLTSLTSKRHKTDFPISSKERKDKLGERIMALQQLVSPYGKTDTASVLHEAMEYIQFLHEQVKTMVEKIRKSWIVEDPNRKIIDIHQDGVECSISPKHTHCSVAGAGTVQPRPEEQRFMSRPDFVYRRSCTQQRRRYLGSCEDNFPQT